MKSRKEKNYIIGAGMTGLSAGYASGLPVFETSNRAGGICSSYGIKPGTAERLIGEFETEGTYRFEYGGGHWIFGGDPAVLNFMDRFNKLKHYKRKS